MCNNHMSHAHAGAPLALTVKRAAIPNLVAELNQAPAPRDFSSLCAHAMRTGCSASGLLGGDDP